MSHALIHTLTDAEFDALDALVGFVEPEAEWRHGYSGRGMFGETCLGLVLPREVVPAAFMFSLGRSLGEHELPDDVQRALLNAHMDHLGRSTIIYWPQVRTDDGTPQPGVPVDL